ncbi:unnamed protein product [Merluccius merluccius]
MMKAPKTKLKSVIKSKTKTNVNVTPAAQAMVELGLLLFLNTLAVEARSNAFEEKSATIRAQHLMAVSKVGLSGWLHVWFRCLLL